MGLISARFVKAPLFFISDAKVVYFGRYPAVE
jgi:hypothetical protein